MAVMDGRSPGKGRKHLLHASITSLSADVANGEVPIGAGIRSILLSVSGAIASVDSQHRDDAAAVSHDARCARILAITPVTNADQAAAPKGFRPT
jgi:hypothetical protein